MEYCRAAGGNGAAGVHLGAYRGRRHRGQFLQELGLTWWWGISCSMWRKPPRSRQRPGGGLPGSREPQAPWQQKGRQTAAAQTFRAIVPQSRALWWGIGASRDQRLLLNWGPAQPHHGILGAADITATNLAEELYVTCQQGKVPMAGNS